jgi:polysaccharide pyruvyl transferase WcaK-like protein
MLDAGHIEHVLVVLQASGPTPIENDRAISAELLALLPEGRASYVGDDLTAGELAALYGECRLVVTVRLHAAILAMVGGAPAYAISYFTAKTAGVMRRAGLPSAWSTHDGFTAAGVLDQLDVLLAPSTRDGLAANVRSWKRELGDEASLWSRSASFEQ